MMKARPSTTKKKEKRKRKRKEKRSDDKSSAYANKSVIIDRNGIDIDFLTIAISNRWESISYEFDGY